MVVELLYVTVTVATEANKGKSYWVTFVNSAGKTITPHMFYEGEDYEGIHRAIAEAKEYARFFGVYYKVNESIGEWTSKYEDFLDD